MGKKRLSRREAHTGDPDISVKFKLPAKVMLALEGAAARDGLHVSTWLRKKLEREFGLGIYAE